MICPYYKNKDVFNGFNEMIEALKGRPMTEEEFRSPELRNQRSGQDYRAMEAAYRIYNRNGGNLLDMTPQGKPSVLFQTLLDHFGGDRTKALIAKSNVYSDEFINWFGDWGGFKTANTKNNLFTSTGEINWNYFEQLLDLYHNNKPDSMFSHGRYTLATRPENHFTGEKNTLNHIKFVTQSMLNLLEGKYDMDLPFVSEARASMQNQKDLMILAAMFHDVAKPYRHGDIHGWESADILRDLLGVDYDNRVAEWAVRHHMPMPFSHKAEFSLSNPEAIEVAKNIARDAKRVGIDANTAINAFVLINAADVINGRELDVDDNWAKKAGEEGLKKYGGDISVKNVLSVELKEKVALLKKAFDEIKDEDFGDTAYNYSHQERFDYNAFPEGGREDKKLPYLNNTEYNNIYKKANPYSSNITLGDVTMDFDSADMYGAGAMIPIKKDEKIIGSIALNAYYRARDRFEPWGKDKDKYVSMSSVGDAVEIDEDQRGKGYGKAAYFEMAKLAARNGLILISAPDGSRTDAATRVWKSLVRDGYAKRAENRYEFINYYNTSVSKVVDENGEPLVMYHASKHKFSTFDKEKINTGLGLTDEEADGFYFSTDPEVVKTKTNNIVYSVFLNARNIFDDNDYASDEFTKHSLNIIATATSSSKKVADSLLNRDRLSVGSNIYDELVVFEPNQIKHVENLGTFNPNDNNIYHSIREKINVDDANIVRSTNMTDSFGQQLTAKLLNGETVSSRDLMSAMLSNGIFHKTSTDLANVLSKHDIPVRLGYSMSVGELAETITDDGGSVILINPNELQLISRGYFGATMMHEIIHAVTVDIINHPKTAEDRAFVELNRKVFNRMSNLFRKDGAIKFDVLSGMHCLDNEKEFAAYFASDPLIRHAIFEMADAIDRTHHMGLFERLKRLVNKLSIAIANKAVFKATDSEQVKIYQKTVEDYLYNRPSIKRGNIPSKSYLKAVYEEQDLGVQNHERFLDSMKRLEQMRDAERNFVMLGTERFNVTVGLKHKPGSVQITSWDRVKDALATRIDALRASNLDSVTKSRFLLITQNQLEMFAVDEAGKYYAIQNLLDTAIPQIIKDIDNLRSIRKESGIFTNGDYMYQMHANLGMYNSVFNSIKKMLDDDENRADMVAAFNSKATRELDKITIEDLQEVERHLDNAINFTQEGINIVEYMLKENVIHKLKTIANEVGNPEMDSYINALNSDIAADAIDDIGTLSSWAGSADSSSNEAVRTIAYIINKAMTSATLNSAGKATDLLRLKENLKKGEKEWHLYETDENGNFTGYLVRDLNFGRFYKNYEKAIEKINKDIRDIFDIPDLQLNNKVAPEINKVAIVDGVKITPKEYFDRKKEEWLQLNAERRYKSRYYEYYSKLPQRVKDSMSEIRVLINSILNNYENLYDENGYPHYEKLSLQDWEKLNSLWEQRRALRSERDEYGNLKKGQDLEDAKALKELYEKLYKYDENGNERLKKLDITGWSRARQAIIDKYGLNSKELDEWDERNTRKHLKKNSYGEALVFKKIEEEFGGTKPQYGEEYERLGAEKQEILNNYKLASGEVDINTLPDVIKNIIIKIDNKRSEIRKSARQNNKTFAELAAKYKEISDKYIKYTETRQFKKVLEEIRKEAERRAAEQDDADALDAFSIDDFMYSMLQETYGYYYGGSDDLFGFDPGEFVPYSWLTLIEALDPQYMEYEPNDAWIDKAENDLSNPNFDESYGTQWVPKRSLYDNSEQYERIFGKNGVGGSETLRALYEGVQQTIVESNLMYNRQYADNFLLPQKECTFLGRLRRKPFWSGIWNYIKTLGGMIGTIDPDISTVAAGRLIGTYDDPNDTEKGSNLQETTDGRYREVGGTYPDGRSFHIIPQYFTRRMKNPQYISRDLVDITASYYKMAQLYKQRADVRDDCEAILDMLKMQQFKTPDYNSVIKTIRRIGGLNNDESNTYQYAKRLIERDLYDIQRLSIGFKLYDFSRILSLWKRWTTARNLGMNPKVAFVGFLTTSFTHMLNGLVGYKYGRKEMWRANNIVLKEFGRSLFTDGTFLGSRLTKNRVMLILEMMDMSNLLDRKTEHSNRNRWLLVIYKNSTYGLMSAADISSKAVIAISTMLSYRLVDGEFMTRHMIEESKEQYGDRYQEMLDKFDKSQTTCYDIFIDGDEKLQIDPQYQAAWDKVKHTVVNKSIKNAELADGMATRLQKAMMTRNFIGAFALIHRQYIPLMIQQTWGARVYDYDAQEYKNHQFGTLYEYVKRLCASNALAAFGGGCFVGTALGGFGVVPLFVGTGTLAISLYKKYVKGSLRKSFKEAIRDEEFFNAGGSTKIRANSVANKYQVKQTVLEVALINCFIAPLANFMAAAADGWDKDDKLTYIILQWLAYTARAFLFEANTKYNLLDLSNNIQSLTAGTSVTEGLADVITGTGVNLFFSSLHGKQLAGSIVYDIYDVYQQEKNSEPDDNVIKNSKSYKGWKRWLRNIFKLTPFHNWWEQTHDPEAKRRYQENKIMRMSDEDKRSWIYEAYQTLKDGGTIFDLF